MSEHWQSPWQVGQRGWGAGDINRITEIVTTDPETGSRWTVAQVGYPDDPESLGIAHLMATAPELRNALDAALGLIRTVVTDEMLDADPTLNERVLLVEATAHAALGSAGVAGFPAGAAGGAP